MQSVDNLLLQVVLSDLDAKSEHSRVEVLVDQEVLPFDKDAMDQAIGRF